MRQDEEGVEGSVKALGLGKAIEDTFLAEGCPIEVNMCETACQAGVGTSGCPRLWSVLPHVPFFWHRLAVTRSPTPVEP